MATLPLAAAGTFVDGSDDPAAAPLIGEGSYDSFATIDGFPEFFRVSPPADSVLRVFAPDVFMVAIWDASPAVRDFDIDRARTPVAPVGEYVIQISPLKGDRAFSFDVVFEPHDHAAVLSVSDAQAFAFEVESDAFALVSLMDVMREPPEEQVAFHAFDEVTSEGRESYATIWDLDENPPNEIRFDDLVLARGTVAGTYEFLDVRETTRPRSARLGFAEGGLHERTVVAAWDGELGYRELPATVAYRTWDDLGCDGTIVAAGGASAVRGGCASVDVAGDTRLLFARAKVSAGLVDATLTDPSGAARALAGTYLDGDAAPGAWTLDVGTVVGERTHRTVLAGAGFGFEVADP